MDATLQRQLAWLERDAACLVGMRRGLEKEALRVQPDGWLAQTPHPRALGSTLTHPYITTDYSEALIELITPACGSIDQALGWLDDLHRPRPAELLTPHDPTHFERILARRTRDAVLPWVSA